MRCFLLACIALLGAGCARTPNPMAELPYLAIERPANGSVTSAARIPFSGKTNVTGIYINDRFVPANGGRFETDVELHTGNNTVNVIAGNGYSTTSAAILIERIES